MLNRLASGLVLAGLVIAGSGPTLAQTGTGSDRPTATGTGSTVSGSPAMNPGATGPLSGTSPTQQNQASSPPPPGQPSTTNPSASPSTPNPGR